MSASANGSSGLTSGYVAMQAGESAKPSIESSQEPSIEGSQEPLIALAKNKGSECGSCAKELSKSCGGVDKDVLAR